MFSAVDPKHFVQSLEPLLAAGDTQSLVGFLKRHYRKQQLMDLLFCKCSDARKVAALCLALVGCRRCVDVLLTQLKDPDPVINQMAEHALWSIWLRSGTPDANQEVCRGSRALQHMEIDRAIEHFDRAIQLDPDFAEAYNQRALAHYLAERWEQSIQDCHQALSRMPGHFGAWSGMGHCHAHLERYADAVDCYEKALAINPHLSCIAETIQELRRRVPR